MPYTNSSCYYIYACISYVGPYYHAQVLLTPSYKSIPSCKRPKEIIKFLNQH